MDPKLSIILVTKNRAKYLDRFFINIKQQMDTCGCSSELIVVDGGSTDGMVDVINKYQSLISFWVSEPDSGVSQAFNKALAKARGSVVKPVADDDLFLNGAFKTGIDYLDTHPEVDCVIYSAAWFVESENGERTQPFDMGTVDGEITLNSLLRFPYSGMMSPEAEFCRTSALRAVGGYDETLHPWAYWDLWLRQVKHGSKLVAQPHIIMQKIETPESDGMKMQFEQPQLWRDEFDYVVARHGNLYWQLWHRFGGELSLSSAVKYCARTICVGLFGLTPRQLLGQRPH